MCLVELKKNQFIENKPRREHLIWINSMCGARGLAPIYLTSCENTRHSTLHTNVNLNASSKLSYHPTRLIAFTNIIFIKLYLFSNIVL